ncbi:MAG: gliding motility-associated C-terminal domain-containing protein [Bacteroidetes bacterium]|nr:gliding motility-associated C-terminal domain-containing protein [Bacteroidota bacterium]
MNPALCVHKAFFILSVFFFFCERTASSQVCNNDSSFFSLQYQGSRNNYFLNATISPQNELIGLGSIPQIGNFISKFNQQGNLLWSYQYKTNYVIVSWMQFPWYTNLVFSKIATGPDSSYYVSGGVVEHGETIGGGETPPAHQIGVLMKIDKFGKVVWGKALGAWYTDYSIGNIMTMANGDLLVYLISFESTPVNRIIRLNNKGNILWATPLLTQWPCASYATHAMKELSNGNIVIGDEVYRDKEEVIPRSPTGLPPPIIIPPPIYYLNFFGLDKNTGTVLWNTNYRYAPDSSLMPAGFIPDIKSVAELPNGNYSFMADLFVTDSILSPYQEKAVNIITNNVGDLQNIIGYNLPNTETHLINAQAVGQNGEQILLTSDYAYNNSVIAQIDKDGQVEWSKNIFSSPSGALNPNYFIKTNASNRTYLLLSGNQSTNLQLVISDKSGNMTCLDKPEKIIGENVTWQWEPDQISFSNISPSIDFGFHDLELKNVDYPFTQRVDCENPIVCCKDIIDTNNVTKVPLCKGLSYTLPDQTIVSDAGRYYVVLKTPKGCDSTVFFDITVSKNPNDLALVSDTCLGHLDSLVLHATDSFSTYNWMNSLSSQSTYTVFAPGTYWVSVSNICGAKTDTVVVYDQCNFPVNMPNSFTPNGDGKNDLFRVPIQNRNHLVRLLVYNRWGELVFATNNATTGWDGYFKGQAQPAGTYIYFLIMNGLDGKEITSKGFVVLIR